MAIASSREPVLFQLPYSGRVALAKLLFESDLHLAWGTLTQNQWQSPEPVNLGQTQLTKEVGRRKVLIKKYVNPSDKGEITAGNGKWTESTTPTRHVYLKVDNDLTDAADSTIYQIGLFTGTKVAPGKEANNWLVPADISDFGTLVLLANVTPIVRNSATRESRQFVISF